MQPQQPIDFEAANYQLSTDPNSRFVQGLIVTRNTAAGRDVLRGCELNRYGRDGSQRSELLDASAVMTALRELFCIDIDALPNLKARIESQSPAMAQATNQTGSAARS
jgi:arylamine N-acetyltransferase